MSERTKIRNSYRMTESMVEFLSRAVDEDAHGRSLRTDPSTGQTAAALERRGMIRYKTDRRGSLIFRVAPTDHGRAVVEQIREARR